MKTNLKTGITLILLMFCIAASAQTKESFIRKGNRNFNKGNYVDYTACSSGQKTILDINFLSKIITRLGLLVFDEFLKHLSEENHDNCIDVVDSMNIGCILISSHTENITSFNNRQFSLSLDASGVTKVEIL